MRESGKHRVLVVDDDEEVLHGIRLRFDAAGFDTIVARNVKSGVHAAHTQRPAAILMDVRLPGCSGLAAVAELKRDQSTRHIPIVMLSGCISARKQALEAGARFFLQKPFSGKDIVDAIAQVTGDNRETVKSRLRYAMKKLKAALAEPGDPQ